MSRSMIRRVAGGFALLAMLFAFPGGAAATINGGCTGEGHSSSSSVDLTTATEWHVLSTDVGGGSGTAPAKVTYASVGASALGISVPIAGGNSANGETSGKVDGVSVSTFALLGQRFTIAGSASGDANCDGMITIIIDDVNPLLTVFGGGGTLLAIVGALIVIGLTRGEAGVGRRFFSAIAAALAGLGASLALEQFGIIDPTQPIGLIVVAVLAIIGFVVVGLFGRGAAAELGGV